MQAYDERQRRRQTTVGEDTRVPKWYVIDAAQTIEQVQSEINAVVEQTIQEVVSTNKPLGRLWQETMVEANKEN